MDYFCENLVENNANKHNNINGNFSVINNTINNTTSISTTSINSSIGSITLNDEDYAFYPIKRPSLIKYYYDQRNIHWVPADIDMRGDRNDYDKCDENTREFIKGILAFFVISDGLVGENLFSNFQEDTSFWKEARYFYAEQNSMETIHGEMYSLMAQTLIRDQKELNNIYNSIRTYPAVGKIAQFMKKYMDRNKYGLLERILAFACVEGILFNSAFAAIYWIKKKNILRGFVKSNEYIARDESIHCQFAITLFLMIVSDRSIVTSSINKNIEKVRVYEIIDEAVKTNEIFIKDIIKGELIGMSYEDLVSYTKCTADALATSLGYEKLYNVENALDWMTIISLPNKTNFFEDKVSEYMQQTDGEFLFDLSVDF